MDFFDAQETYYTKEEGAGYTQVSINAFESGSGTMFHDGDRDNDHWCYNYANQAQISGFRTNGMADAWESSYWYLAPRRYTLVVTMDRYINLGIYSKRNLQGLYISN